jgi:putative acetyltransferase
LRAAGALLLSLVAVENGKVVGHIAFSPVEIRSEEGTVETVGLAPLAVLPEYQQKGIGLHLVEWGLQELQAAGHKIVFVLGDPNYYRRFGFVPAARYRIRWEHKAPDEAFMVKELRIDALYGVIGVARFRPEFDSV